MVQSPSWEANWFAASQEIPRISRNPNVHYLTHKRPPPDPILGQPNPVHIPTSHLLEIRPIIIHPSTPRSPQWSPSLRFPHQNPTHTPLLTHTRHMPSPSHFISDFTSWQIVFKTYHVFVALYKVKSLSRINYHHCLNKSWPTRWHMLYYILPNMFQTLIRPFQELATTYCVV